MTPSEYQHSIGVKCPVRPPAFPHNWCSATVTDILDRQEYTGDTVNFRSFSRSFKQKKRLNRPQEEWKVFPDTHSAIIDWETFALVQDLRQHRRRPTKTGIVSMFSGLLYCADCSSKLGYSATNNYKHEQAFFLFAPLIVAIPIYVPPILFERKWLKNWYLRACNSCCGTFRSMKSSSPRSRWSSLVCKSGGNWMPDSGNWRRPNSP